ncbi:acylphosphatase-2 isoform X2 [Syngnathus acus]|uniref:acylphosphatase-2 isoform X2 n=2 Tax=Syngnathus acus TaxID=161584 RepID=UPI0018863792|nr:acylphosphatase-2 isoform X2 [Syngnathus acus]
MSIGSQLLSVDFEVFGHVQGVCFRMYTEKEAAQAGVVGWVKNTRGGTVVGQLQGPADAVEHMKEWLSKKGSPSSHITRTLFNNERTLSALENPVTSSTDLAARPDEGRKIPTTAHRQDPPRLAELHTLRRCCSCSWLRSSCSTSTASPPINTHHSF